MKFRLRIVKSTLDEARQEKKWIKGQPEKERPDWEKAEKLEIKLSDMAWIRAKRGDKGIEEVAKLVAKFRKDSIQKKLKDNGFNTNLSSKNPKHTLEYLKRLLQMVDEVSESDESYDEIIKDPSQVEFLGKVGNWEVLMPKTMRGSISCDISGDDTTWCTTKKDGQNLFYSYVGRRAGEDVTLFYVMDYTRTPQMKKDENDNVTCVKDCDARLSFGWTDRGIQLKGQDGGLSVNAGNKGLGKYKKRVGSPDQAIAEIFAVSEWNQIKQLMQNKWESIDKGASHPAKEMLQKSAQNVMLLKKIIKNYNKQEKDDYIRMIVNESSMAPEVEIFIASQEAETSSGWPVRQWIASHTESPETLREVFKLWPNSDLHLVYLILKNPNCPDEILKEVLNTPTLFKSEKVQKQLVLSTKITEQDLAKIAKNAANKTILTRIVVSTSVTPEILDVVARHPRSSSIVFKRMLNYHRDDVSNKTLEYIALKAPFLRSQVKDILARREGGAERIEKDIAKIEAEIKKIKRLMEQHPDQANYMRTALINKEAELLDLKFLLDKANIGKDSAR